MTATRSFGHLPLFDPARGVTVVEPPGSGTGFWAGAPSAVYDAGSRRFVMAYRLRRPPSAGAQAVRGYCCAIATSLDGIAFETVAEVTSAGWGTPSIERSALLQHQGEWRLYVSSVDPADNRWRIDMVSAGRPEDLPTGRRVEVMTAASTGTEGVKDPVAWTMAGLTWMLIPYGSAVSPGGALLPPRPAAAGARDTADLSARHASGNLFAHAPGEQPHPHPTALAVSRDGIRFRWLGDVLHPRAPLPGRSTHWDRAVTRASALVYVEPAWHMFYDGRTGEGDIYEDRTGLAVALTADLLLTGGQARWESASPEAPALTSPWGTGCLRYLDAAVLPDRIHYYYECCRADGSHELRTNVVAR